MDIHEIIEIFAAVTGVAYVILEIYQKKAMWIVGILTGAACAWSFFAQDLYASMLLNIYYTGISVLGIIRWKKAEQKVGEGEIHLAKISTVALIISGVFLVAGTAGTVLVLDRLGDGMPVMDAFVTILSIIATVWLTRSYLHQWHLWIVADTLSAILCFRAGMYWMCGLYGAYALSAVIGLLHWKNRGKYV